MVLSQWISKKMVLSQWTNEKTLKGTIAQNLCIEMFPLNEDTYSGIELILQSYILTLFVINSKVWVI